MNFSCNFTPGLKDIASNKAKRKKPTRTKRNRKRKIDQDFSDDDDDDGDNSMDVDSNSQEVEFMQADAEVALPYSLQSLLVTLVQVTVTLFSDYQLYFASY